MAPLFYLAPAMMAAFGAPVFSKEGFEADDVMATLGAWAAKKCVVCCMLLCAMQ